MTAPPEDPALEILKFLADFTPIVIKDLGVFGSSLIEQTLATLNSVFLYLDAMTLTIWAIVLDPVKALEVAGDLTKTSLGPTLAFLWGRWATRQDEEFRQGKEQAKEARESEAVRTTLKEEIAYNFNRVDELIRQYDILLRIPTENRAKGIQYISPHGLLTQAFESQVSKLATALSPKEITDVFQMYGDFRAVAYAYDLRQPKVIYSLDETEKRLCEETLWHLKDLQKTKSTNPIVCKWFPEPPDGYSMGPKDSGLVTSAGFPASRESNTRR